MGARYYLRLSASSTYSSGVSYITQYHIYLALGRCPISVSMAVSNATWNHLLWMQKSVMPKKWYSLCPMALLVWFPLLRDSYGVGRLSGIAYPSNWYNALILDPHSHWPKDYIMEERCESVFLHTVTYGRFA
jgi:hypothetical protein